MPQQPQAPPTRQQHDLLMGEFLKNPTPGGPGMPLPGAGDPTTLDRLWRGFTLKDLTDTEMYPGTKKPFSGEAGSVGWPELIGNVGSAATGYEGAAAGLSGLKALVQKLAGRVPGMGAAARAVPRLPQPWDVLRKAPVEPPVASVSATPFGPPKPPLQLPARGGTTAPIPLGPVQPDATRLLTQTEATRNLEQLGAVPVGARPSVPPPFPLQPQTAGPTGPFPTGGSTWKDLQAFEAWLKSQFGTTVKR